MVPTCALTAAGSTRVKPSRCVPVGVGVGCGPGRRVDTGGPPASPSAASSARPSGSACFHWRCSSAISPARNVGSSAPIRSSRGGWVAYICDSPRLPSPKSMWLTCRSPCSSASCEPSGSPAIFFNAPASPTVCRVNCTEDASASHSRCRLTAALIRPAKNWPTKPSTMNAIATMTSTLPPLSFDDERERPPPNARKRNPTRPSSRMPLSRPISRTFSRMSPLRTWLNSCPITPCSSSRLSRSSAPAVAVIAASAGL